MRRQLLSAAAGALIATSLAGGIAWAAIPAADGQINGCYQKNEGQLRVIDPGTDACRPSEIRIVWSQAGGPGLQGDPGAPGSAGRDGLDGTSVSVLPEPAGSNCPAGGIKLVGANGVAYACNAAPPDPGLDG